MNQMFKKAIQAFTKGDLNNIKNFAGWFAKKITQNIMDENRDDLTELVRESSYLRSDIEFSEPIKMTKEFYLGYCYAYENIARRLLEESDTMEEVDMALIANPRIKDIIYYLGNKGSAYQNEIAEFLGISASNLCNVLNTSHVKALNIFNVRKIGKHVVYRLNNRGKQYYLDNCNEMRKIYSKNQILELLSLLAAKNSLREIKEKVKIFDEELVKEMYRIMYLNITANLMNRTRKQVDKQKEPGIFGEGELVYSSVQKGRQAAYGAEIPLAS